MTFDTMNECDYEVQTLLKQVKIFIDDYHLDHMIWTIFKMLLYFKCITFPIRRRLVREIFIPEFHDYTDYPFCTVLIRRMKYSLYFLNKGKIVICKTLFQILLIYKCLSRVLFMKAFCNRWSELRPSDILTQFSYTVKRSIWHGSSVKIFIITSK